MLNGLDPILIFQFKQLAGTQFAEILSDVPLISKIPTLVDEPPIPIYLSESLTGLFVDTEDKNIDIVTDIQTQSNGEQPLKKQRGLSSIQTINITGKKDSIGVSILTALCDSAFDKATSAEYTISYLHGAVTIFRATLEGFSVNQNANSELLSISISLSKGEKAPTEKLVSPTIDKIPDSEIVTLESGVPTL